MSPIVLAIVLVTVIGLIGAVILVAASIFMYVPVDERVEKITPEIFALAGGAGSSLGTGGMETKLRAGLVANGAGIPMVIMNGKRPEMLYDLMEGRPVGTRFEGRRAE